MTANRLNGGCFCGAVRYRVLGPEKFACFCHCQSCQRATGAPVVAWATYARETLMVTRGEMLWHRSSPGVSRGICRQCGTSMTYENERRIGEIDVTMNSLDDPCAPTLRAHIWTEDRQPWLTIDDELAAYRKDVG